MGIRAGDPDPESQREPSSHLSFTTEALSHRGRTEVPSAVPACLYNAAAAAPRRRAAPRRGEPWGGQGRDRGRCGRNGAGDDPHLVSGSPPRTANPLSRPVRPHGSAALGAAPSPRRSGRRVDRGHPSLGHTSVPPRLCGERDVRTAAIERRPRERRKRRFRDHFGQSHKNNCACRGPVVRGESKHDVRDHVWIWDFVVILDFGGGFRTRVPIRPRGSRWMRHRGSGRHPRR